jgi:hypothetical protein
LAQTFVSILRTIYNFILPTEQFWKFLVNLSTRLTQNLKTSHEIFIKIAVNKNFCHRNKVPGKRIEFLPIKYIFFQRKTILVNIINLWRAVSVKHLFYNSCTNKGVTANKNRVNKNVQTLSYKMYTLIRVSVSMLTTFVCTSRCFGRNNCQESRLTRNLNFYPTLVPLSWQE